MQASAPTKYVWLIGIILGILGILGHFVSVPFLSDYNYWLLFVGFILLAIGTSFKGV